MKCSQRLSRHVGQKDRVSIRRWDKKLNHTWLWKDFCSTRSSFSTFPLVSLGKSSHSSQITKSLFTFPFSVDNCHRPLWSMLALHEEDLRYGAPQPEATGEVKEHKEEKDRALREKGIGECLQEFCT
ncbi:vacuolar protein sorting 11 [Sesbania bispinosa]|nr:vacuolar protein sorting 11 [Sesbania bispinosa]